MSSPSAERVSQPKNKKEVLFQLIPLSRELQFLIRLFSDVSQANFLDH